MVRREEGRDDAQDGGRTSAATGLVVASGGWNVSSRRPYPCVRRDREIHGRPSEWVNVCHGSTSDSRPKKNPLEGGLAGTSQRARPDCKGETVVCDLAAKPFTVVANEHLRKRCEVATGTFGLQN